MCIRDRVRAAEDISTPDGTLRYSKSEVVDTITTSSDGFVKSKKPVSYTHLDVYKRQ